ncbi:MAG: HDIG domain-containing metalloprotein [Bacteroidota bacterium]
MSRARKIQILRKLKSVRYLKRMGLLLVYVGLLTLIMPRNFRLQYQFQVGKSWVEDDLRADYDFSIFKDPDSLEVERVVVANEIPDIYVKESQDKQDEKVKENLSFFFAKAETYHTAPKNSSSRRRIQREIEGVLPEQDLDRLKGIVTDTASRRLFWQKVDQLSEQLYEEVYIRGTGLDTTDKVISIRTAAAREDLRSTLRVIKSETELLEKIQKTSSFDLKNAEDRLLAAAFSLYLNPNYLFSAELTKEARETKSKKVSPVKGKVSKGDIIVKKGELVDMKIAEKLSSLIREEETRFGSNSRAWLIVGQFMVVVLITTVLLAFLQVNRPRIYFDLTKLSLVLCTLFIVVMTMVVSSKLNVITDQLTDLLGPNLNLTYIYMAPACAVAIFMLNFFDARTAYVSNILVALYGGVLIQQSLEFVFVQIIAGTVAVYSLRNLREREEFFFTLAYVLIAYILAYFAFNLFSKGAWSATSPQTILLFLINVVFTVIAYNLIYIFEQLFRQTSDITFLELLDTNHPLLKELSRKSPGTFQHSLQVASIAEATINEIGGNPLLIHVAALYHDIGKLSNQKYFIENMSEEDKRNNPHDKINCKESARIIIGHVKEGVRIAKENHLPKEIIQFIESHHGTTRVEFFYRQFLAEEKCNEPEGVELFQYPGPLPTSKEMAVLMIADSIEAASRSVQDPTPEKLEQLVNHIIDYKIKCNQLDNSNLTFKDLKIIREVCTRQLMSIYHARIKYPEQEPA